MATFRVDVTLDFEVEDGTDADEWHDGLRDALESEEVDKVLREQGFVLETVRDITVTELED